MACLMFKSISIVFSPILLLLLCFTHLSLSDLNSEKQALLDFANSVHHGPKLNWKLSTPVCSSWTGVTCTTDQTHVLILRLPGVGLLGQIPPSTLGKLDHLQILSLRNNRLTGSLPSDLPSLPSLRYLYLQKNAFTGHLPDSFAFGLKSLDLSYNLFSGEIPMGIQNLSQLVTLNLSNNSLSGPIPDLKLPGLRHLNFSNNNLNGSIPFSLQHFPVDTFVGNGQLCGPPLPQCSAVLPGPSPSPPLSPNPTFPQNNAKNSTKKLTKRIIIVIVAGGVALFLLLVIIIMLCISKRKDRRGSEVSASTGSGGAKNEKPKVDNSSGVQMAEKNKLVFFDGCSYTFDLEDLLRASAEVLGKGSYGTAYKAALEDGTMVVVKRLKEVVAGKKEFEQQMEMIDRVGQHPNLAQIRAYYYSKDEKLLVYDYASASSFSNLLHGNRGGTGRTPLDWDSRVKIVIGAAKGIAHIHSEGGAKFVHGNIKSSNILLSQTHSPIVSDYGLAPLMNTQATTHSRVVVGYRAPEFIETRKPTHKSDVYSFGVLLLEVLTGKSPIQAPGYDDVVDLPRWVHSVVREEWTAEVFDMELMRYPNIEEEMVQMLQLGMACVSRTPDKRPNMVEVVRLLEDIRRPDSESRPSSEARGSEGETTWSAPMEPKR